MFQRLSTIDKYGASLSMHYILDTDKGTHRRAKDHVEEFLAKKVQTQSCFYLKDINISQRMLVGTGKDGSCFEPQLLFGLLNR